MEIPKISVVVPVYNVEKYLKRCLESLTSQSLKDIEIIVVNDGSTDNSLSILKEYIEKDNRIRLIEKTNGGLSSARNAGLEVVTGEYVSFVDSDDWIHINMFENMYEYAKKENCDVVMCSYSREYANKSRPKIFNLPDVEIYDNKECVTKLHRKIIGPIKEELADPEHIDSLVTAWGKLYRSSIIRENQIKFIDTSIIGTEDCLFNVYTFKHVKKAIFLNRSYYYYWKENANSLTSIHKENLKERWMNQFRYIRDFLDNNQLEKEFYTALNNRICLSTLGLGLNECNKANQIPEIEKIKNLRDILKDKNISFAFKNLELKYFPVHWKVFFIFNKYKVALLSYFMLNFIEFIRTRV